MKSFTVLWHDGYDLKIFAVQAENILEVKEAVIESQGDWWVHEHEASIIEIKEAASS